MIERLYGKIIQKGPTGIIIDVNGVGYGLELPLNFLCDLGDSANPCEVWVYTHVREDAIRLFGFRTYSDKQLFDLLLSVSGVGPKTALALVSTLSVDQIRDCVFAENTTPLSSVPGIGPRLAEKILVELKSKIKKLGLLPSSSSLDNGTLFPNEDHSDLQTQTDVKSALENLGFKSAEVQKTIFKVLKTQNDHSFASVLKSCLVTLGGAN